MANKSSPLAAILRRKVREALNIAPGFGQTESQLHEYVGDLAGFPITLQELRDAREWNHEHAFVRSEDDDATGSILWYITKSGQAQQKI